ncbi:hypothetical protein EPO17_00735 [Patescibacteria group bacterium]|nr:MAG: hypothetical protein EPO17_00735 [Patescibacteria group bacterium]
MKTYTKDDLLEIINRAEIVRFVASELGVKFQKPKVENWDNVALALDCQRRIEDSEIILAVTKFSQQKGFLVHFLGKDADCILFQGVIHEDPCIRLTVSNDSATGIQKYSGQPVIKITATLEM